MLAGETVSLTLLAAKFGATHFHGPQTAKVSSLIASYPPPSSADWDQSPALLDASRPPLIAAGLPENGGLAVWDADLQPEQHRARNDAEMRNAVEYLESKVQQLNLAPGDTVLASSGDVTREFTLADVAAWVQTVAMLSSGWTMLSRDGQAWLVFVAIDGAFSVPFNTFDYARCDHPHS